MDQDAHAFERFIRRFLTKYDRWNSPKYLFGESYGTPRSAVLSALLAERRSERNRSAFGDFELRQFGRRTDAGIRAWTRLTLWRCRLMRPRLSIITSCRSARRAGAVFERGGELCAGRVLTALLAGSHFTESAASKAIAEKLHEYTGLPVDYLLKANLRVAGGEFSKTLQDADGMTTGRMDTRYRGPDLNRLSEEAEYDPQAQRHFGGLCDGHQPLLAHGSEVRQRINL